MNKHEALTEAEEIMRNALGSPYAWLCGAMSYYLTEKDALAILQTAKEHYGDKK